MVVLGVGTSAVVLAASVFTPSTEVQQVASAVLLFAVAFMVPAVPVPDESRTSLLWKAMLLLLSVADGGGLLLSAEFCG